MRNINGAKTSVGVAVKAALLGSTVALAFGSVPVQADFDTEIFGYVKADFIQDLDDNVGDSLSAFNLPAGEADNDGGHFRAHARQSRFGFKGADKDRDIQFFLEGGFFGNVSTGQLISNGNNLRVRHAWVRKGAWTFGQGWSTFLDKRFIAYPQTVDFSGPVGLVFMRQPFARYSTGNFDIALENPENGISGAVSTDARPDIVARYSQAGDKFSWQVAGFSAQYEVSDAAVNGALGGESTTTFGVSANVALKVGDSGSSIFATTISNGGRYLYHSFFQPRAIIVNGEVEEIENTGVSLGAKIKWGGPYNARTTIVYGVTSFDDEFEAQLGSDSVEETTTFHLNYIWNPVEDWEYGVEVSQTSREAFDGTDNENNRLQFSAKLSF